MSSNGETNVVLRGVTHGAVDFLIKPVRIEELRNVWQHVVRRKRDQVTLMFLSCVCIFLLFSIFLGYIVCALHQVFLVMVHQAKVPCAQFQSQSRHALAHYSAPQRPMNDQCLIRRIHTTCADQVKEGREGSDEDADEVTGGVRRGSGEKKRKGDVRACLIAAHVQP